MFVLNCPSCGHKSRVKFARMGAVATCVGCKQKFKVESRTLIVEEDAPVGSEAVEEPTPVAADAQPDSGVVMPLAVEADSQESLVEPEPYAEAPGEPENAAEALEEAQSQRTAAPTRKSGRGQRPRPTPKKGRGANPLLVLVIIIGVLGAGAGLAWVFVHSDKTEPTHGDPDPSAVVPKPPDEIPTPANPPKDPPKPPLAAHLVRVPFETPRNNQISWKKLSPPVDPFKPAPADDTAIWNTWLERRTETRGAVIHALFVLDRNLVHKSGALHIQLLDAQNHAYAELMQEVPAPCAQRGVHLRIAVPEDLISSYASHLAEFAPLNAVDNAQVLDFIDTRTERVNPGHDPAVLKVVIRNPSDQPVSKPHLVLEALDAAGGLLGTWQADMNVKLKPGTNYTFEAAPPLPSGSSPARVIVRGYGIVSK